MEAAVGAATGLVGSVLNLLSNELVGAYVASTELGLNSNKIREDLMLAQALLQGAQTTGAGDNPGLQGLLQELTLKADEAEDALDELHYFIIQDQLDGTRYAVPDLGDDLRGHARHGRHALRHVVGNCLACFSCSSPMQDDAAASGALNTHNPNKTESAGKDDPIDKLKFDRVAMSKKIKSVMEEIQSLCDRVSKLPQTTPHHGSTETAVNLNRPPTGSISAQHTLYGRKDIFERTVADITSGRCYTETLSVLPVIGPGGIGKTTFAQHLYNDKRIQKHFAVRVWVCVSTDFDVLKLSQQILCCIQGSNTANQTNNLAELQKSIAEKIKSKRFLIVFDDIWKCNNQGWEDLLAPLTEGETKGNMVLVTTRFPSIAERVKTTPSIPLKGLEYDEFFTFFEAFIFDGKKPEYQGDLAGIARDIAKKLKGSPLAGKTVGRLLRKEISRKHWMDVLENDKWQKQENDDGIMTSLRISYDYLPSHLKKCFPYFAIFPEDYRFQNLEITYFWIAIGIIGKDVDYMEQLVENGFIVKEVDHLGAQYYVMHDLLHELSRSVSSQECLNICSSSFTVDAIPQKVRYLSVTVEDRFEGNFREEMIKLRSKIDIGNLRALMIFREYERTIDGVLQDIFKEIEGLRVLHIVVRSPESLLVNFPKLIHLRYLKITGYVPSWQEMTLSSTLSRFYHLKFLELGGQASYKLPKDISRLINLRHFRVEDELHSNVPGVGKMKYLQELKKFCVQKESVGFELRELGELTELGGQLSIHNLEKVATKEEAKEARLVCKRDLEDLRLVWGTENQHSTEYDVIDALEPHPNLGALSIINHGGTSGPSWLCGGINFELLECLHLEGVSWVTLPPFEQLPHLTSLTLRNIYKVSEINHVFGGTTNRSFLHLKKIILDSLPELIEWVGVPNDSFSRLETIYCSSCPNLRTLPFLQECSADCYNHLSKLQILDCPKLSQPPMPHSSSLINCHVRHSSTELTYSAGKMVISGYGGDLALCNLQKVMAMSITDASHVSLTDVLQMNNSKSLRRLDVRRCSFTCHGLKDLACLQYLTVYNCGNFFPCPITAHTNKLFPASLKTLEIEGESGWQSMALLSILSCVTDLVLVDCENLTVDGFNPLIPVNLNSLKIYNRGNCLSHSISADLFSELVVARTNLLLPSGSFQLRELTVDCISAVLVAPICSLLAATLHTLEFWYDQRAESFTEEEDRALQLLTSLRFISFMDCPNLLSLPQGLHSLPSLMTLFVQDCPKIRSLHKGNFPTSLECLFVEGCSPDLQEQAKKLKGTDPDFNVILELE